MSASPFGYVLHLKSTKAQTTSIITSIFCDNPLMKYLTHKQEEVFRDVPKRSNPMLKNVKNDKLLLSLYGLAWEIN